MPPETEFTEWRSENCWKLFLCGEDPIRVWLTWNDEGSIQLHSWGICVLLAVLFCCIALIMQFGKKKWELARALRQFLKKTYLCFSTHVLWCLQWSCAQYWFMCNPSLQTEDSRLRPWSRERLQIFRNTFLYFLVGRKANTRSHNEEYN